LFSQVNYENYRRRSERSNQPDSTPTDRHRPAQLQQHHRRGPDERQSTSKSPAPVPSHPPHPQHQQQQQQQLQHRSQHRTTFTTVNQPPPPPQTTTYQPAATIHRVQPNRRPVKYLSATAPRQRRTQNSAVKQVLKFTLFPPPSPPENKISLFYTT